MICPHCHKDTEAIHTQTISEQWFAEFWQIYPRHAGKATAIKAWKKAATAEAIKDEIMAGLRAQLKSLSTTSKSFIPHASTWLNGRRWEDEIPANTAKRVIECGLCADTGLRTTWSGLSSDFPMLERCSCARGQLPGLVIPQAEETPF